MTESSFVFPELAKHTWEFSYFSGIPRVHLRTAQDIQALEHLDPKLWAALGCPTEGIELDKRTLQKIDSDNNGHIHIPEVIESVYWVLDRIKNPADLLHRNDFLPIQAIREDTPEGRKLIQSAQQVLTNIGKVGSTSVSKEDTADMTRVFAKTRFNGDGVITPETPDSPELQSLISLMVSIASVADKNGQPGVNQELTENFYAACEAYKQWEQNKIQPLGTETAQAYEIFLQVKDKIEDFFLRCQIASFDPESFQGLQVSPTHYNSFITRNITESLSEIETLPLAFAGIGKLLPLTQGVNPAWQTRMTNFLQKVVQPIVGETQTLNPEQWQKIQIFFQPYSIWLSQKAGESVEHIGIEIIQKIVLENQKDKILKLIEQDKALEESSLKIEELDKLICYYCDIPVLLKNFVNFDDFYNREHIAIFQAGKLYIDERCCELCVKVHNVSKLDTMAPAGNICLLYCECIHKTKGDKMIITAALTNGSLDRISVGRNAVFVDNEGNDWSATVIKVIEQPISIKEAFWMPYKKFGTFITSQIEKFASSKEKEVETAGTASIEKTTVKIESGVKDSLTKKEEPKVPLAASAEPKPAATPFDIGKFVGIFAAISLAMGAIGSVIMSFLTGFFALKWWQMPIAMAGIILTISLPSMILAYLKLRKRNLALVLEANGWAINSGIKINIIFGQTLTHLAKLPVGSSINLNDPFSKKKSLGLPILIVSIVLGVLLLYVAYKYHWFPFAETEPSKTLSK